MLTTTRVKLSQSRGRKINSTIDISTLYWSYVYSLLQFERTQLGQPNKQFLLSSIQVIDINEHMNIVMVNNNKTINKRNVTSS